MKKNEYVSPKMEISDVEIQCYLQVVSQPGGELAPDPGLYE